MYHILYSDFKTGDTEIIGFFIPSLESAQNRIVELKKHYKKNPHLFDYELIIVKQVEKYKKDK